MNFSNILTHQIQSKYPTYSYTYGAEDIPNRMIVFDWAENKLDTAVFAINRKKIIEKINDIAPQNILFDQMSTSQKFDEMMKARKSHRAVNFKKETQILKLPKKKIDDIFNDFKNEGTYEISVVNGINESPKYEYVESLTIFSPK